MKITKAPPPQVSAKDGPIYGAEHPQSISAQLTDGTMVKEVYIRDSDVVCVRWGVPYVIVDAAVSRLLLCVRRLSVKFLLQKNNVLIISYI